MGVRSITALPLETLRAEPRRREQAQEDRRTFLVAVPSSDLSAPATDDSSAMQQSLYPRLTIREMNMDSAKYPSQWAMRIPDQAIFYDEVDSITRGRQELGIVVDRRA